MNPVDQLIQHDPDNGVYGDCLRACVASILELGIESVPHFLADGDPLRGEIRYRSFLRSKKLLLLELKIRATDPEHVPDSLRDVNHLITGVTSSGNWHAVVGQNGKMVFDPGPARAGLETPDYFSFLLACPRGIPP